MAQFPKDNAHNVAEATQGWIQRVQDAGAALVQRGSPIGDYFLRLNASSIATQRDSKDKLSRKLKASVVEPQIVTVQSRGGERGGAYLIIPLDKVAETLEARNREGQFVPITASLRKIGGDIDIPAFAPRGSGRRLRSSIPTLTGPTIDG